MGQIYLGDRNGAYSAHVYFIGIWFAARTINHVCEKRCREEVYSRGAKNARELKDSFRLVIVKHDPEADPIGWQAISALRSTKPGANGSEVLTILPLKKPRLPCIGSESRRRAFDTPSI